MARKKENGLFLPTLVAIFAVLGLIAVAQFFASVGDATITSAAYYDITSFNEECAKQGKVVEEVRVGNEIKFVCKNLEEVGLDT